MFVANSSKKVSIVTNALARYKISKKDLDTFFVGEKGGYEKFAYDVVLQIQKDYPSITVILVVSSTRELSVFDKDGYNVIQGRGFDSFIFPPKAQNCYRRWSIVYRNNWIIENTDFIIAYNRYQGRAFEVCKRAKNKGVTVIELTEIYK